MKTRELPSLKEIVDLAMKSKFLKEPHIQRLLELSGDKNLFDKSPDYLMKLRRELFRNSLKFFSKQSQFYCNLFERLGIDPDTADKEDLVKLAVPSDLLRGEGYKKLLIENLEEPSIVFSSSGTTSSNPVNILRTYLELAMMTKANTLLFEYVYGSELKRGEGIALFLAAKELRNKLNFVAFVDLTLQGKEIPLLYGMDLISGIGEGSQWGKLVPNKKNIMAFLKSKREPKLLFTAPAGVYLISKQFNELNFLKKLMYKVVVGVPPVNLGNGGVVVTGGGSKGIVVPPYDEVVKYSRRVFKARSPEGKLVDAPFMDVLGMTETLTALIDRYGVMNKIPHPLQEVFLLDLKTYTLIDEPNKDGILGIYDPMAISWLEIFLPGDIVKFHESNRYYGKEYIYVRRLSKEEGWDLQRACGGALEEMMGIGAKAS